MAMSEWFKHFTCISRIFSRKWGEESKQPISPMIKKPISLKIALDTQHSGKPKPKHKDKGASHKGLHESDLVQQYFEKAKKMLEEEGHQVFINDPGKDILTGWYGQRHEWANNNNIDLYLAGHLNSARKPGNYSLVMVKYDVAPEIFNLANSLAEKFKHFLSTKFATVWKVMSEDDPLTLRDENRGYSCIDGVECPAFLLEPAFINNPDFHILVKEGLAQNLIAMAIVEFVREFTEHLDKG